MGINDCILALELILFLLSLLLNCEFYCCYFFISHASHVEVGVLHCKNSKIIKYKDKEWTEINEGNAA